MEEGQQVLPAALRRVMREGFCPGRPQRQDGREDGEGKEGPSQEAEDSIGWGCMVFHWQASNRLDSY